MIRRRSAFEIDSADNLERLLGPIQSNGRRRSLELPIASGRNVEAKALRRVIPAVVVARELGLEHARERVVEGRKASGVSAHTPHERIGRWGGTEGIFFQYCRHQ